MKNLLIILGAPLWIPLLICAVAVELSLGIAMWAILLSAWSIFAAFAACAVGAIVLGIMALSQNSILAVSIFAAVLVFAGLAIYAFCLSIRLMKLGLFLTKRVYRANVECFR